MQVINHLSAKGIFFQRAFQRQTREEVDGHSSVWGAFLVRRLKLSCRRGGQKEEGWATMGIFLGLCRFLEGRMPLAQATDGERPLAQATGDQVLLVWATGVQPPIVWLPKGNGGLSVTYSRDKL